ncbi:MAG: L,D-transpeptidase family protein [Calditerrivibrio sp.]|nr:L,D-transpeptidase family protein [Calditerrivibrio sp.]
MIKVKMLKYLLFFLLFLATDLYAANKILADVMAKGVSYQKVFLVDKSAKKSFLIEIKNDSISILKEFDGLIIGEGNGDKRKEGDKKTPTGVYYVTGFIPQSKLDKIYGTGAFPLNYPNFVDKLYGKTGHGIWIHGRDPKEHKQASKGCVVLKNEDIDYLRSIDFLGTPVVIAEHLTYTDEINYNSEKSFWLNFLNEFYESWKNNDINRLSKLIHVRFKDSKHSSYAEYIQRKKALMEMYPDKKIVFENIKIYKENDSEVVFDFDQYYSAPNITTYGTKRLYLIKEANDFKIIAEEYIQKPIPDRFKNVVLEKSEKPKVEVKEQTKVVVSDNKQEKKLPDNKTTKEEKLKGKDFDGMVKDFVKEWKESWESKDIDRYIAFYGEDFRSGKLDYKGWKEDKKAKFERIKSIKVDITDLKIKRLSDSRYEVTFKQIYKTESMNNKGIKKLTISKEGSSFKIVGESWSPSR